jgi:antitoxin VapB
VILHPIWVLYKYTYHAILPDMALSLKNSETERLARLVADQTGESITEAIRKSLEERWERLKSSRRSRVVTQQVEEILRRVDALPTLDPRSPDEILGYDQHGTPH